MFRVVFYNAYGKGYKDFSSIEKARAFAQYIEKNAPTVSWRIEVIK